MSMGAGLPAFVGISLLAHVLLFESGRVGEAVDKIVLEAKSRYNPPRGSKMAYYFVKEEVYKFSYSNSFYYR